jgi:hypothetical protein
LDEQLDDVVSGLDVDLTANLRHDYLNHSTEHVLLIFYALAISLGTDNGLFQHVANWKQHLRDLLMRLSARMLDQ